MNNRRSILEVRNHFSHLETIAPFILFLGFDHFEQCKWSVESSDDLGVWQPGTIVKCEKPGPLTHLAVARTEESDGSFKLRLFYQSANRELRQTSRDAEQTDWSDTVVESDLGKVKLVQGSGIGIWVGWSTRIFYQSSARDIVKLKEENGRWTSSKCRLGQCTNGS